MIASLVIAVSGAGFKSSALSDPTESHARSLPLGAQRADQLDRCRALRRAVYHYSRWEQHWRAQMGAGPERPTGALYRSLDSCPRYLAHVLQRKARAARQAYLRWLTDRTLTDHSWWRKDVREVQRVFPGTEEWLMSCSASEGGWGRWVGYGGRPYSEAYERQDGVGGQLQFRPSTFRGFIRHAIDHAQERGFRIPESARSWLSSLGQALAGAWGVTNGLRYHWEGSGCR